MKSTSKSKSDKSQRKKARQTDEPGKVAELEKALQFTTQERDHWKDKATSLALKMADELSSMRL
jgi:hypothetical protein